MRQKRLFGTFGFLTTRLIHVRMIVCYIGRMISFLNLAKFVAYLDGRRINIVEKPNLKVGKRYQTRFYVIFL